MFNRHSPFVVDQRGLYWFWLAVIPALILAAIFRLSYSEVRVSAELRKAFLKLEPEIQLQFSGAKLNLSSGLLYPQISIQIFDLNGFYLNALHANEPIKFSVDEVNVPISLIELITGRLALNLLEVGHMQVSFDESILTHFTIKPETSNKFDLIVPKSLGENKTHIESSYRIEAPRPIERVRIKSIRPEGVWGKSLGLEFRNVELSLTPDGKAELSTIISFLFDKWGSQPSLPMITRWNPEDKFVTSAITSRWREGQINIVLILDPAQDFYSLEGGLRSLPLSSFMPFLKNILNSNQHWMDHFIWTDLINSETSGWVSFDFGVTGYLVQKKPALFTLRNLLIEDGIQVIEVSRYSQMLGQQSGLQEPLSVSLRHISFERFAKLFGLNEFLDSNRTALSISGNLELRGGSHYYGQDLTVESFSCSLGEMSLELVKAKMLFKSNHDKKQIDISSSMSSLKYQNVKISENNEIVLSLIYDSKTHNWEVKTLALGSGRFEYGTFENLKIDLLNSKIQAGLWQIDSNIYTDIDMNSDSINSVSDLIVVKSVNKFKGSWKHHKSKKFFTYQFEAEQDVSSPDTLQGKWLREGKQKGSGVFQLKFWPVLMLNK